MAPVTFFYISLKVIRAVWAISPCLDSVLVTVASPHPFFLFRVQWFWWFASSQQFSKCWCWWSEPFCVSTGMVFEGNRMGLGGRKITKRMTGQGSFFFCWGGGLNHFQVALPAAWLPFNWDQPSERLPSSTNPHKKSQHAWFFFF